MKQITRKCLAFILAFLLTLTSLPSAVLTVNANSEGIDESLRLAVISDLHYYPVSYTGNENKAYQDFATGNLRLIGENSAATKSAVEMILADHPEVVLVTGDLTNDGEKQSAIELAALLQCLEDRGIKVYVINGNHDINSETAVSFESGVKTKVDNISPTEFRQIFKNFGYDGTDDAEYYQSLNTRDEEFKQGGMSYIVTPKPGYKILMLDSEVYTSDYLGQSKGMLSSEVISWAVEQLTIAQENGEVVVGGMHHPLMTHFGNNYSSISLGMSLQIFETIDNNKIAAEKFANANLKYIFTGHMHGNDIAEYVSRKGNKIIDIETAALGVVGSPVRFVEVTRDDINISSKGIDTITWRGQTLDYQSYLKQKLYTPTMTQDMADQAVLDDLETLLSEKTLYSIIQDFLGINVKETLEATIIDTLSETMEVDASVGKIKVNMNLSNPNDPIIHMWPTGTLSLLPDYDVSIRNNIFVGLDDLMITQFKALWLTPDANGQTRLNRALHQVIADVESMQVHENGKNLHDLIVESIQSSTLGNESTPEWVAQAISDFKITLSRRLAKDYLIPSLKTNIINPFLDEMFLDINKTFPSKSIYRDALGYILGGEYGKQRIPLRGLLENLAEVDVDAEIDDLIHKYVDNDSDISMLGNPIALLIASQWTDSTGHDDVINGESVRYVIPDADPNAIADVEYKNIHLGVGSNETESFVTWYSTSAIDGKAQIAKKSDSPDGKTMPSDISKIREVRAVVETTIEHDFTSNKAIFTNLEENTDYLYRVGNEGDWSDVIPFRTESFGTSWGFVFSSDAQIGSTGSVSDDTSGWYSALDLVTQKHPNASFILHTGDQVEHPDSTEQYDAFLNHNALRRNRLSTLVGNHDDGDFAYSQHFQNPNVQNDGGTSDTGPQAGNYWYIYNNVLFISLNANNNNYDEHIQFLRSTVNQQGSGTDWQIVTYHQSTYSAANHSEAAGLMTLRAMISPVMSELGIDAVLMGHDHVYVRTYMMDGTTPQVTSEVQNSITDPSDNLVLYVTANSPASKHYKMKDKEFAYAAVKNQEGLNNISYIQVTSGSLKIVTYRTEQEDLVPFNSGHDMTIVDEFTIFKSGSSEDATSPSLSIPSDITMNAKEFEDFDLMQDVEATRGDGTSIVDQVVVDSNISVHIDGTYKVTYHVTHNGKTTYATRFVTITGNTADVHFDSKGGSQVDALIDVHTDTLIQEPAAPTRQHYVFSGWYTDETYTTKWDFQTDKVIDNLVLYAKWEKRTYRVSFESNGGDALETRIVEALSQLEDLPLLEKDNYVFGGWYKDESLNDAWKMTDVVEMDTLLYARWIELHESIVVFDPTNSSELILQLSNTGDQISEIDTPVREGYIFVGWNTERDGSGDMWSFENDRIDNEELYLYAQWDFQYISIHFDTKGGSAVTSQDVIYGSRLEEISIPTRNGYSFNGWTYDTVGLLEYSNDDVFTTETTLYAQWGYNGTLSFEEITSQYIKVNDSLEIEFVLNIIETERNRVEIILTSENDSFYIDEGHIKGDGLEAGRYEVTVQAILDNQIATMSFTVNVASSIDTLRILKSDYDAIEVDTKYLTPEILAWINGILLEVNNTLDNPYQDQDAIDTISSKLESVNVYINETVRLRSAIELQIATADSGLSKLTALNFEDNAYEEFYELFNATKDTLESPQQNDTLTAIKNDIHQAYMSLMSRRMTADVSKLHTLYNQSIAVYSEQNYTPATWKMFADSIKAAEAVLMSADTAVQKDVDNAYQAIEQSIHSLVIRRAQTSPTIPNNTGGQDNSGGVNAPDEPIQKPDTPTPTPNNGQNPPSNKPDDNTGEEPTSEDNKQKSIFESTWLYSVIGLVAIVGFIAIRYHIMKKRK